MNALEMKCGIIKHDVSKLIGVYGLLFYLMNKNIIQIHNSEGVWSLHEETHKKRLILFYLCCWLILKDIPWWGDLWEVNKKKLVMPMKHKVLAS